MFLLIFGVVGIIAGALIYRELGTEPIVRLAAALCVLGGIICIIVGIIDVADVRTNDAALVAEDVQIGGYSFEVPGVSVGGDKDSYGTGSSTDSYGTGGATDSYGTGGYSLNSYGTG